jgi:nucleotide-binding universal stress UspA family protein
LFARGRPFNRDCISPCTSIGDALAQPEEAEGDVAPTIAQRADALGCEAIIMGTRGSGRIANLVMGSTAMMVVHLTSLPVTLVK